MKVARPFGKERVSGVRLCARRAERPRDPAGVAAFMSAHSETPYATPSMEFSSREGVVRGRRVRQRAFTVRLRAGQAIRWAATTASSPPSWTPASRSSFFSRFRVGDVETAVFAMVLIPFPHLHVLRAHAGACRTCRQSNQNELTAAHVHHRTRPNLVELQKMDLFGFPPLLTNPVGLNGKESLVGTMKPTFF